MDRSVQPLSTGELARLWKPKRPCGILFFKAHFNKFFYKKHKHREFAIRVAQKFHHKGNLYVVAPRTVITVNPDEIHDGMPATQDGYQYRMVYISQRIFKNTTDLPPHAYLIQMRVELAKTAIEKGCSIASAALQSGFSDQSHLTRLPKSAPVLIFVAPGKQDFYRKFGFGNLKTGMGLFPHPELSRAKGYLE